jgi:O-antigen/teichoic acid export membrane protein
MSRTDGVTSPSGQLRTKATGAIRWASIGYFSTQFLSFLTTVVTARLLAPEIFGLVTLVLVLVTASKIFADAGTRAAIVQLEDPVDDVVATAVASTFTAGLVGSVVIAAGAPLVSAFYDDARLTPITVALAGVLFVWAMSIVPDAVLQRNFDLKIRRGIVAPGALVVYAAVVIPLALLGLEEWALVAGQWASTVFITAGAWLLARRYVRRGRVTRDALRRIRKYARPLFLANLVETVEGQAKPIAIGRNAPVADVGLWGAAHRLHQLPVHGITVMAAEGMFPALSRLQGDMERFARRAVEALRLICLLAVPVCLVLVATGEELVVTLFGERWRGAGTTLQILSLGALAMTFADGAREVFKASGRSYLVARNALYEVVVFLTYLTVIWVGGWVSLSTVAAGTVLSALVATGAAVRGLTVTIGIGTGDVFRALRPVLLAGAVQVAVMLILARVVLGGFERWHHIGALSVGPLVPLAILGAIAAVGMLVYAGVAELTSRGIIPELLRTLKSIIRPSRAAA